MQKAKRKNGVPCGTPFQSEDKVAFAMKVALFFFA